MREKQREEEGDTDNPFRYNTIGRQREGEDEERKDGGMKKKRVKNFFWSTFCKIKALAGERDVVMHKWGERMTGMEKRLLLSLVALMWAEDKVRLEIGMPGAQWKKKEWAWDGRMRTGEKSWRKKRKKTAIQTFFQASRKEDITSHPGKKKNKKNVALYSRRRNNLETKPRLSVCQYNLFFYKFSVVPSKGIPLHTQSAVCVGHYLFRL